LIDRLSGIALNLLRCCKASGALLLFAPLLRLTDDLKGNTVIYRGSWDPKKARLFGAP
jgi:hypothetical protein